MPKPQPFLSKTKYLDGLKCPKLLWYKFNKRSLVPKPDVSLQAIFDQGHRVGEIARKLYPDGIKIERDWMPEKTHAKSLEAIKQRKPLFESGLIYGRAYALPDILIPVGKDEWDLIEVKSGTTVEDVHLLDAAFQKYVYTGAGLKLRRCYLLHINTGYLRKGEIDPEKLLIKEEITEAIMPYLIGIEKTIDGLLKIISGNEPKVKISPHCGQPYGCPLEEFCRGFLPEGDIFQLRGKKERLYELMDMGILKLTDIPIDDRLNEKQLIQINCQKTGEAHIDRDGIKNYLAELKYPLYLLDFETIAPAIPVYDLSHPYEKIPFQFSLHVIQKEGAKPEHYGYLAPGDMDPRAEILARLKKLLNDAGAIVSKSRRYKGYFNSAR